MKEGLLVTVSRSYTDGSCNFCNRKSQTKLYVIESYDRNSHTNVRMCQVCLDTLINETK